MRNAKATEAMAPFDRVVTIKARLALGKEFEDRLSSQSIKEDYKRMRANGIIEAAQKDPNAKKAMASR